MIATIAAGTIPEPPNTSWMVSGICASTAVFAPIPYPTPRATATRTESGSGDETSSGPRPGSISWESGSGLPFIFRRFIWLVS